MSRNENEDITNAIKKIFGNKSQETTEIEEKFYYKNGKSGKIDNDNTCAKSRYNPFTKRKSHYVKVYGSKAYDPSKAYDARYESRNKWKFRSVSFEIFSLYIRYLQTKRESYLRNVERLL